MSDGSVLYRLDGDVAVITLNEPESRNALSQAIRSGLLAALERLDSDDRAKVGILTGAGDKAFCAGAHLGEMAGEALGVPPAGYVPIVGRGVDLDKLLIAAVNGAAHGGGLLLAQMADLAVAAEHATFAMPEARWSRGAPWSVPLSRMIPQRVWLELLVTGDPIDARRAYEIGFVNRVVPAAELMPAAMALARRIAANAPLTVRASREMVQVAGELGLTAAWDAADELFEPVYRSQDALEGPRAFRERREPRWEGR